MPPATTTPSSPDVIVVKPSRRGVPREITILEGKEVPMIDTTKRSKHHKLVHPKPHDKPKRPLSAYNIFFQLERSRILSDTQNEPVTEEQLHIICQHHHKKEKRRHRKSHGKIGFAELARTIANKWKQLNEQDRQIFHDKARLEKDRYQIELHDWNEKQKRTTLKRTQLRKVSLDPSTSSYPPTAVAAYHHPPWAPRLDWNHLAMPPPPLESQYHHHHHHHHMVTPYPMPQRYPYAGYATTSLSPDYATSYNTTTHDDYLEQQAREEFQYRQAAIHRSVATPVRSAPILEDLEEEEDLIGSDDWLPLSLDPHEGLASPQASLEGGAPFLVP